MQAFIGWQVESYDYIPIGTEIKYKGQKVRVAKLELNQQKEELIYTYTLKFKKGLKTPYKINEKLQGTSLEAIVKKRRNNEAKVHFCINKTYEEKETNKWFSYTRPRTSNLGVVC